MRTSLAAVLTALTLVAATDTALGAVDDKKVAAGRKAAAEFIKSGSNAPKTGAAPRQTDPKVKALLDVAFDTTALGKPEFNDLPKINPWMIDGVNVGLVYMLAGTGTSDIQKAAADPKLLDRINKNIVTFDTEYGRYVDFQLVMSGFILEAVRGKLDTASKAERDNPKFQAGFAQISGGVAQTMAGVLTTFVIEGVTPEWQRARLAPLLATAASASKTIPKPDLEKLREIALEVSGIVSDEQVKAGVKDIADTFVKP